MVYGVPSCEVAESVMKNSAIKYLMLLYMECLSKNECIKAKIFKA
jgi:hypothetical protein